MNGNAHPFSEYIRLLGRGKRGSRSLDFDEARAAMRMVLDGTAEPVQVGAFLMLLRVKEETPEELAGFVDAARGMLTIGTECHADLDWSSYAGKRRHHPWFLLAALALADNGVRVFMHGGGEHTPGRLYTETALGELGITACRDWQAANKALQADNFGFMPLRAILPRLEQLIELKPLLGLRSPVNSLARLLNPLAATHSIHSIFHPRYGEIHEAALALLDQPSAVVFKGEGGEAERRPDAGLRLHRIADGTATTLVWPRLLDERAGSPEAPGTGALRALWRGDGNRYGEAAVLGTLAIAAVALRRTDDAAVARQIARQWWQNRRPERL